MGQSAPHYMMLTYIGNDVVFSFFIYRYFLSPIIADFYQRQDKYIAAGLQDSWNALVASALLFPIGEDDWNQCQNSICFLKFPLTKPVERQIPYTLFGLARAVRLTPEEVLAAFHTDRRSKENAILRDAVLKVAAYTLERTLLGELNYQSALEALRAMGLNQAAEQADGVLEIVLDSAAERYSK